VKIWFAYLVVWSMILTACGPGGVFEDSSERATREAENQIYLQTIQAVETQASTIEALQSTVQSVSVMGTQIVRLEVQNQALEATLEAAASGNIQAVPSTPQPAPAAAQPGQTVQPGAGSTPLFPNAITPTVPVPTPIPASSAIYNSATTAMAVNNSDGCAADNTTTFTTAEDEVYIVVEVQNVPAGITFYSRWTTPDALTFDTVSYTPDQPFDSICIWFFITPQDLAFITGEWTVELIANEQSVISRGFTIQ